MVLSNQQAMLISFFQMFIFSIKKCLCIQNYNPDLILINTMTGQQLKLPEPIIIPANKNQITKLQRLISILVCIIWVQLIPQLTMLIGLYGLFTLNFKILAVLAVITICQSFAKKSPTYIKIINEKIQVLHFFKKFERYYEQPIEDPKKALYAFHPHSIFGIGMLSTVNSANDPISQMTMLVSRFIFHVPFLGLVLRFWGAQTVNKKNMVKLMKKQKPIGVIPGGFQQATITTPNQYRIFIKHRKGFIKCALNHGYTVYPVLVFNQHKIFSTFDYFTKFRLFLNKFKLPAVLFSSRFGTLFPFGFQLTMAVGKGIKGKDSSKQELQRCHQQYMKQIERMYQKYKSLNDNTPLVFY